MEQPEDIGTVVTLPAAMREGLAFAIRGLQAVQARGKEAEGLLGEVVRSILEEYQMDPVHDQLEAIDIQKGIVRLQKVAFEPKVVQ
jgi:hypothetical protein